MTAVGYADGRIYAGFFDGTLSVFPDTGEGYLWATSSPVGRVSG